MSTTNIYIVKADGNFELYGEIPNGNLGGLAVWSFLGKKYINKSHSLYSIEKMQEVWTLNASPELSNAERICLYSTFDRAICKIEDAGKLINAFEEFGGDTSLNDQAKMIVEIANKYPNIIGVAWCQTSVIEPFYEVSGRAMNLSDLGYINYIPFDELIIEDQLEGVK